MGSITNRGIYGGTELLAWEEQPYWGQRTMPMDKELAVSAKRNPSV